MVLAFGEEDADSRYTTAPYNAEMPVCTTTVGVFLAEDAKHKEREIESYQLKE